MLSIRRELIEHDDFAFAVKALQRFDGRVPMHALLRKAHALYKEDHPRAYAQPPPPPQTSTQQQQQQRQPQQHASGAQTAR